MPITPITTGVKVTYSRENFQTVTANRNSWATDNAEHLTYIKEEGITEGFYPKVVPGLNQIQIRYSDADQTKPGGNNMIGTGVRLTSGGFVPFSLFSNASVILTVPNNPNLTVIYYLLCWKFNSANTDEGELVFMPGGVTTDPDLDQEELDLPGVRYLPICRIERTNTTLVQGDVKLIGATTYNPNKTVRPLIKYQNSSVQVLTTVERSAAVLNDATLFLLRDTTADGTLKFYDLSQNKDVSLKYASENIWTMSGTLNLGTYNTISSTTGTGINSSYTKLNRVSPATPFENVFSGVPGTGSFVIPANSLKVGDKIVIRAEVEIAFSTSASGGSPNGAFQFRVFANDRTVASNNLNSTSFRYNANIGTVLERMPVASCYTVSSTVSGNLGVNQRSQIRLEGTVISTGASGVIRFVEIGDFYAWSLVSGGNSLGNKIARTIICDNVNFNTTIANTLIFDFDVIRSTVGTGFNPTFTLNTFQITKE